MSDRRVALRHQIDDLRRRHNALIVIAVTPDEVAFAADPRLSVRDAESTVTTEMPLILHSISEQRRKQGARK